VRVLTDHCHPSPRQADPLHVGAVLEAAASVKPDAYKYFLAGSISASASHGWTVPIDVVKTRLQTDASLKGAGIVSAAGTILSAEGPGALASGLGSTLVGYAIQGSLKYGMYEVLKPLAADALPDASLLALCLAATCAETIGSTCLCPLEATRIRLVAEPSFGSEVFDALPKLLEERGWEIMSGLPAILAKMIPYTVVQLVSYELLTTEAYTLLGAQGVTAPDATVRFVVSLSCSLVAAALSSLASQVPPPSRARARPVQAGWGARGLSKRRGVSVRSLGIRCYLR
jgi:solute carrier family 25 phosphate transporter 3